MSFGSQIYNWFYAKVVLFWSRISHLGALLYVYLTASYLYSVSILKRPFTMGVTAFHRVVNTRKSVAVKKPINSDGSQKSSVNYRRAQDDSNLDGFEGLCKYKKSKGIIDEIYYKNSLNADTLFATPQRAFQKSPSWYEEVDNSYDESRKFVGKNAGSNDDFSGFYAFAYNASFASGAFADLFSSAKDGASFIFKNCKFDRNSITEFHQVFKRNTKKEIKILGLNLLALEDDEVAFQPWTQTIYRQSFLGTQLIFESIPYSFMKVLNDNLNDNAVLNLGFYSGDMGEILLLLGNENINQLSLDFSDYVDFDENCLTKLVNAFEKFEVLATKIFINLNHCNISVLGMISLFNAIKECKAVAVNDLRISMVNDLSFTDDSEFSDFMYALCDLLDVESGKKIRVVLNTGLSESVVTWIGLNDKKLPFANDSFMNTKPKKMNLANNINHGVCFELGIVPLCYNDFGLTPKV